MAQQSEPIALFAFYPEQWARREAQLARIREISARREGHLPNTEPAYQYRRLRRARPKDGKSVYELLAPDLKAKVRNEAAHRYYLNLYPLLYPNSLRTMEARGVRPWSLLTLRAMVDYYRARAYGQTDENERM